MKGRLRSFVALAIAAAALAATHGFNAEPGQSRRPDVIVVLTDQQRADAFGAAGAADLHTPVMDRLARQGVLFTRAFTATPQCSPSRAALLTGRYPHRTGVMGNTAGEGSGANTAARDAVPPSTPRRPECHPTSIARSRRSGGSSPPPDTRRPTSASGTSAAPRAITGSSRTTPRSTTRHSRAASSGSCGSAP